MKRELQGRYVTISTVGEKAQAFVPAPLPPRPPIDWTPELRSKFDQALLALGRLDSVSTPLPDTSLFLYMYVRRRLEHAAAHRKSAATRLLFVPHKRHPFAFQTDGGKHEELAVSWSCNLR